MMMPFWKMHANGNDFVIVDSYYHNTTLPSITRLRQWADRQTGIGFDQLLYVTRTKDNHAADLLCRIFNAWGSEAEQCGHGMACLAYWLYTQGNIKRSDYIIKTRAGLCQVKLVVDEKRAIVNMGHPVFNTHISSGVDEKNHLLYPIYTKNASNDGLKAEISKVCVAQQKFFKRMARSPRLPSLDASLSQNQLIVSAVTLGNPHCVVFGSEGTALPFSTAKYLSQHSDFPKGTNVEWVQLIDSGHMKIHMYERGVGENRACGTGACAAMVVGRLLGYLKPLVHIEFPKGDKVVVVWDHPKDAVMLDTTVHLVFQGELFHSA